MLYTPGQLQRSSFVWGLFPVCKDCFIMWVSGMFILCIVSFSNFVDISSYPELLLVFNLLVISITLNTSTGSRNILFVRGAGKQFVNLASDMGIFWFVFGPMLAKYSLKLFAIVDLSVSELLFIFNFSGRDLSFPFPMATFSIDQDFFYIVLIFQVVYCNIVFLLTF